MLRLILSLIAVLFIGLPTTGGTLLAQSDPPLGEAPLCEASALAVRPCMAGETRKCFVVADNERDAQLFFFQAGAESLLQKSNAHWIMPLKSEGDGKLEIGDIEALVSERNGDVLLIGSHGRSKKCELKKKRLRVGRVSLVPHGEAAAGKLLSQSDEVAWRGKTKECATKLFRLSPNENDDVKILMTSVCAIIVAVEDAADAHAVAVQHLPSAASAGEKEPCKTAPHFNIEGAAQIDGRLWVGLRGPLLDPSGQGADGPAILLRVAPDSFSGDGLRFDGVTTIDLRRGGTHKPAGIRDLAVAGEWLWGIAGSVADSTEPSWLWRVPLASIANGARLSSVEVVDSSLSALAEGLAVDAEAGVANVIMDGDAGDDDASCKTSAAQIVLNVRK